MISIFGKNMAVIMFFLSSAMLPAAALAVSPVPPFEVMMDMIVKASIGDVLMRQNALISVAE